MKTENRYLNLAGAPWSPDKTDRRLALSHYFSATASALTIFGAAQVLPHLEKNQAIHLAEGIAGAGLAIGFSSYYRRREAKQLSTHHERLVIDMKPDATIPPTSTDVLTRVEHHKSAYRAGHIFNRSLQGAAFDSALVATNLLNLTYVGSPHVGSFFGSYFLGLAVDVTSRYRQFNKISKGDWVISDQGDAIKNTQQDDIKNGRQALAFAPIRHDPNA